MPVEILPFADGVLCVRVRGELKKADLDRGQALAEEAIRRSGKIRVLAILEGFLGWERDADWSDISFAARHDKDIEKIGVVGEEGWRDLVHAFTGKGFRSAAVEYFPPSALEEARVWVRS